MPRTFRTTSVKEFLECEDEAIISSADGKTVLEKLTAISTACKDSPGPLGRFQQINIAVAVKPTEFRDASPAPPILIRSLNVSCQCDRLDTTKNMVGMIVYSHQGLNEWYLNGIHAKSGYIVIKETDKLYELQRREGGVGSLHSLLYKLVFGQAPGPGDMASGFSIQKGVWVFNSGTLNMDYKSREMPVSEQTLIKAAILKRFGPGGSHADKIYQIKDLANSIAVMEGDFVRGPEVPLTPEDCCSFEGREAGTDDRCSRCAT
ncbi:hypothetical protein CEUSTIGMA_g2261.t1 [Chlamydomonas eustigma]|uniref:Uncharacterized protein n=1 Tax=Chlamydomonas eustigma TaxID=1157962 RepID=A0A250WVE8_9CHLO|nr:hypothetical protein CEUSTIGMA_g2261.t1 [Chlamydomonas eustigma]|eukprot:GAX74814.1 hypothetical protein CEUSTIGMA_g2261.t1 [Chlamydomonas eustigma]